jgi:hypothetical protein
MVCQLSPASVRAQATGSTGVYAHEARAYRCQGGRGAEDPFAVARVRSCRVIASGGAARAAGQTPLREEWHLVASSCRNTSGVFQADPRRIIDRGGNVVDVGQTSADVLLAHSSMRGLAWPQYSTEVQQPGCTAGD